MNAAILLLWLIVPAANAWLDRNRPVRDYLQVNGIRAIFAVLHGALVLWINERVSWPFSFDYSAATAWELLKYVAPLWAYQIASYWVVFEAVLNLIWKEDLLYYDISEGNSGWVDRFFKWTGKEVHAVAKVLALILAVYSFKVLLNY